MQAGNAARGVGTLPGRGRLEVLLTIAAVLAVAAMVAVAVWVVPLATSGVGAEDARHRRGFRRHPRRRGHTMKPR